MRQNFPLARIVVLASPIAARVLEGNPFHLEVKVVSDQWELFKSLAEVRKKGFDLAVGLSQMGTLFTRYCAAKAMTDFNLTRYRSDLSVVQLCLDVIQAAGLKTAAPRTEFWFRESVRDNASARIDSLLTDFKCDPAQPLVALHCGGHYFIRKRWPLPHFGQLIRILRSRIGVQIVLVGGREDREIITQFGEELSGALDLVGYLKLEETAVLLQRSRLFIGNDSGPLHLAAALQVPTIGLFGPTNPQQFYPYQSPRHTYIYKAVSCSPCFKFRGSIWQHLPRCTRSYCMEAIAPEEVAREAVRRLKEPGEAEPCFNAGKP
ncbi:MAG TPA: glycosyltransferase family 9 protein [Bacillota bacterium]